MPRGGRRPGAGAPRGNHNALKHGFYSKRVQLAALMLAASPELQLLLQTAAGTTPEQRISYRKACARAANIVITDPKLAASIRQLLQTRLQTALHRISPRDT